MKLIIAIVPNDDGAVVTDALTQAGFFITKLSTVGGFLSIGNTTLLIGTSEEKIPEIKKILKESCKSKAQINPALASFITNAESLKDDTSGAVMFVINVESFDRI